MARSYTIEFPRGFSSHQPATHVSEIFFTDIELFLRMRSSVVRRYHWICQT